MSCPFYQNGFIDKIQIVEIQKKVGRTFKSDAVSKFVFIGRNGFANSYNTIDFVVFY